MSDMDSERTSPLSAEERADSIIDHIEMASGVEARGVELIVREINDAEVHARSEERERRIQADLNLETALGEIQRIRDGLLEIESIAENYGGSDMVRITLIVRGLFAKGSDA